MGTNYKNSTLEKLDRLDRLVRQIRNANNEVEELRSSIKKDLTTLREHGMVAAMDAGYRLFKLAREGNLVNNDSPCCQKCCDYNAVEERCFINGNNRNPHDYCPLYRTHLDVNQY